MLLAQMDDVDALIALDALQKLFSGLLAESEAEAQAGVGGELAGEP